LLALDLAELAAGIFILYWGAEWLIRGSAAIARAFGVKPLVVGLTVVAYGASAPELAVATKTALSHSQPIALGTVIGSCAANISLILGLTALISPPTIDGRIIRREIPVLLGSAIAVPLLLRNGVLSRLEGALLVLCALLFTIATLTIGARLESDDELASDEAEQATRAKDSGVALGGAGRPRVSRAAAAMMSALGLVLLLVGSQLLVDAGRTIAGHFGLSERLLGLTVIALSTALPELIASLVAASRGQSALAIGSVIGSNLLNVFLVLGVTAWLRPIRLGERMHVVDLVGLVAITLLGVFMLRGSRRITRFEGAILVAAYLAFMVCAAVF
jgi:cation:H+ antiporter